MLELVSGADYDALAAVAVARRARIRSLAAVIEDIARAEPRPEDLHGRYSSLRERARQQFRRVRLRQEDWRVDPSPAGEVTVVWRCPDCGGLDAPQPCLEICIWSPTEWVDARAFRAKAAESLREIEYERAVVGLLTRLAFVTPRDGHLERNWQALRAQARLVLER
jgi:hypothetical protein